MSEMKRVTGSGKKPYQWKDNPPAEKRSSQPARKAYVKSAPQGKRPAQYKAQPKYKLTGLVPSILFMGIVALGIVLVFQFIGLNASKARLKSVERAREGYVESIEACELTLEMETRAQVICQKAEEKLYMVRPSENHVLSASLFGGETQTAGR